jgi:hypothetical protein
MTDNANLIVVDSVEGDGDRVTTRAAGSGS